MVCQSGEFFLQMKLILNHHIFSRVAHTIFFDLVVVLASIPQHDAHSASVNVGSW